MAQLFANNISTVLSNPCGASDTTLYILSALNLPVPSAQDWFYLTIATPTSPETAWEIVKVTGVNSTVLTVQRGVDNTAARAWSAGARVELRPCAAAMSDMTGAGLLAAFTSPPAIGSVTPNTVRGTTVTATIQFSGPGTGLTGVAAGLTAGSANAAPWAGITNKPTTIAGFGITDAITTGNIGSQTVGTANGLNAANTYTISGLTVNGAVNVTGDVTAFYSDRRLKENIHPIQGALQKALSIHGMTYSANELAASFGYADTSEQVGVIAQDVQLVMPQAVKPAPFDLDPETGTSKSGEDYLTVKYERLVPLLFEALREEHQERLALSCEVKDLREAIKDLQRRLA